MELQIQIPYNSPRWVGILDETEKVQQTHKAFLVWWNKGPPNFFCPRTLRRMASLLVILCCGVEERSSGCPPTLRPRPRLGFFTIGPELDSSNVLLKLAKDGVLSSSCALDASLGEAFKDLGSGPTFRVLEGDRVPGGFRPNESCARSPSALPPFSSGGAASREQAPPKLSWSFVSSPACSGNLPSRAALLQENKGRPSEELNRGHKSSSTTCPPPAGARNFTSPWKFGCHLQCHHLPCQEWDPHGHWQGGGAKFDPTHPRRTCCGPPAELEADSDSEEVGEEPGPVLESGEGSEEGSVSEAEREPGLSDSYQLPSESDISEAEEQLEPVPSSSQPDEGKS